MLYVPGSNERALEKAQTLMADSFIFDLEDSVAPDKKPFARKQVCDSISRGGYGKKELLVRVNGLNTEWGYQDICSLARSGAEGIVIPKVESANVIKIVESILHEHNAPKDLLLWCMLETPLGILNAKTIAQSSRRLGGFIMGTSDLAKDLFVTHTKERLPLMYSLGHCLVVARAYGLSILDGVYLDLNNYEGFNHACIQGKEMGFDGKTLIHPKTIDKANEVFSPDPEQVTWSHNIIDAFKNAQREGQGLVVVDGKLIENLHVEEAQRILALSHAIKDFHKNNSDPK